MRDFFILMSLVLLAGCSGSNNNSTVTTNSEGSTAVESGPVSASGSPTLEDASPMTEQSTDGSSEPTIEPSTDTNPDEETETTPDVDTETSPNVNTGTASMNPEINSDNYRALLVQAFEVFSGRAYDDRLNSSSYVTSHDVPSCDSGVVDQVDVTQYVFSDCVISGEKLNGRLNRTFGFENAELIFSDGFSSDLGGLGEMRLSGVYSRTCCSTEIQFSTFSFGYEFSYSGGSLFVREATVDSSGNSNSRVMHGNFSMQGTTTNDALISVSTGEQISISKVDGSSAWGSEVGTLNLMASDGSSLSLRAGNGDPSTLELTISNANGVTTITESWALFVEAIIWSSVVEVQSLHYNAGAILNKLAGDDLRILSNDVIASLQHAMDTASSSIVNETLVTLDPSTNPATETSVTVSNYQCGNGGSLDRTQTSVKYQEGGFYFLGEYDNSDVYVMNNCVFPDAAANYVSITLNGQFELSDASRSGRKHSSTSASSTWSSYHQVSVNQSDESAEYFVDASLNIRSHNNDGSRGGSRSVVLTDYEFTSEQGVKESIDNGTFSQAQNFGTNSGVRESTFSVSGDYTGPLSDSYKVSVSTQADFDVLRSEFGNSGAPEDVGPSGEFTLSSVNGDVANIELTGEQKDEYYSATFNASSTDVSKPLSLVLPFYKYVVDRKGFAEEQWTYAIE